MIDKFGTYNLQILESPLLPRLRCVSRSLVLGFIINVKLAWLQIQQSKSFKNKIKNDKHYFLYVPEQIGNQQDEGKHTEEEIHGQHSKQTYLY